jgi:F-type H+-transporting ATPase subunit b
VLEVLQSAEHVFAASGGIASLGIDVKALILQILTFVIVFLLLKKFAFGKIVDTLETRRKTIDDGVHLGQELASEKAKLQDEIAKIIADARKEADNIITAGHSEASQVIKDAEDQATARIEAMLAEARGRIDDDLNRARAGLKKEMLELISEATEVIIDEKLDPAKDAKLISRALKEEHA